MLLAAHTRTRAREAPRVEALLSITANLPCSPPRRFCWILLFSAVEGILEKRTPYRPDHIAALQAGEASGKIALGGAFNEPADGAIFSSSFTRTSTRDEGYTPIAATATKVSPDVRRRHLIDRSPQVRSSSSTPTRRRATRSRRSPRLTRMSKPASCPHGPCPSTWPSAARFTTRDRGSDGRPRGAADNYPHQRSRTKTRGRAKQPVPRVHGPPCGKTATTLSRKKKSAFKKKPRQKRGKKNAVVDWSKKRAQLARKIRAQLR